MTASGQCCRASRRSKSAAAWGTPAMAQTHSGRQPVTQSRYTMVACARTTVDYCGTLLNDFV